MILEFYPIFASVVYKKNFLGGKKFPSFLHISKKSSTFAADIGLRTLQFYTTMKKILSLFTLILLVQWTFAVDPSTNLQEYYASAVTTPVLTSPTRAINVGTTAVVVP